ncbi:MAG: hypothetical protein Q9191_007051 [Dirinaria sp. TL-2023a]
MSRLPPSARTFNNEVKFFITLITCKLNMDNPLGENHDINLNLRTQFDLLESYPDFSGSSPIQRFQPFWERFNSMIDDWLERDHSNKLATEGGNEQAQYVDMDEQLREMNALVKDVLGMADIEYDFGEQVFRVRTEAAERIMDMLGFDTADYRRE